MNLESIKDTYFAECADQLAELEVGLFSMQSDGPDTDVVNSVFRAVHSIKGGAGAFALDDLVNFSHVFENALDVIRTDLLESNEKRIELLLRCSDVLSDIVAIARDGGDQIDCSAISAELENEFNLSPHESDEEEADFEAVAITLDSLDFDDPPASSKMFEINFVPKPELYLHGHDPQKVFRELSKLGTCIFTRNLSNVPPLDKFDPKYTNLSWSISVQTDANEQALMTPFEWIEGLCDLSIAEIRQTGESVENEEDADIEAFLLESSSIDESGGLENILNIDANEGESNNLVVAEPAVQPNTENETTPLKDKAKTSKPIRVESEKVDRLINLMGEMVISQSMLTLQINQAKFGPASPTGLALVELQNLTREIQSSVMAIRAQPIKPVFMRMSRVVREVCTATGKKANLVLEGEHTEVDTTVIEGLSDPLTHMIRNSVDHGIERVEERSELGKPKQGEIKLSASHSSGNIVIEIRDDGAGINRVKVLELAKTKGIIPPDAKLSDDEIDNLIFAPGFSTSEAVTDVSGRGVGMDVVRQSIQSLGGRVSITSTPGKGSHFTLHLPLTLAILEGMLVQASDQMLVLPVTSVVETMVLRPGDVFPIGDGHRVLKLRNQLVPIIDVGHELGFGEERAEFTQSTVVVVESGKSEMSAFLVDAIVGQQQVVIKSMESNYQRIPSIAAATILGSGKIALILDVDEIVTRKVKEIPNHPVLDKIA